MQALRFSGLAVILIWVAAGLTQTASAQTTTVQPGPWLDSNTWDGNVPTPTDDAIVVHDPITVDFGETVDAASLAIGSGAPGRIEFTAGSTTMNVVGSLQIGNAGGSGTLFIDAATDVFANSITIGASASGFLISEDNDEGDATAGSITVGSGGPGTLGINRPRATTGEFRVGADGSRGRLIIASFNGDARADNGFTLGAQGVVAFTNSFSSNARVEVLGGDLTFDVGSTVDALEMKLGPGVAVGERYALFTYAGNLIGLPALVPPLGYGAVLDTSIPGEVAMELTSIPGPVDWIAGTDSYLTPGNWDTGVTPLDGGFVFIRNGGTTNLDGNEAGAPAELQLNKLTLGDVSGDGTMNLVNQPLRTQATQDIDVASNENSVSSGVVPSLDGSFTFTDSPSLRVGGSLEIGCLEADGTGQVSGTGSATIERVSEVIIGGDLDVGLQTVDPGVGASATGHGSLVIRDVPSVVIGSGFDVADGAVEAGSGRCTVNQSASVLIERVESFVLGSDLDVGQNSVEANETDITSFNIVWRDIGLLDIGQDLDYVNDGTRGIGSEAGFLDVNGHMTFERCTVRVRGDIDLNSTVNVSQDGVLDVRGTLSLIESTLTLDPGDTLEMGDLDFASGDPGGSMGGGAPGNYVGAFLFLGESTLEVPDGIKMGRRLNGAPGELDAELELNSASRVATSLLEVGSEGTILVGIEGVTRVTPGTVGDNGLYSGIDADDAILGGEFVASFNYLPTEGTHTFDLLITNSPTALDDTTATFEVRNLSPSFSVDSFGVVEEGGVDRIRLVITASCSDGNVDSLNGSPDDVLLVNGSAGGAERTVVVPAGTPFTIQLQAPPAGPSPAVYGLWLWSDALDTLGVYDLNVPGNAGFRGGVDPVRIGCTVGPTPFDGSSMPQPMHCVRGAGVPGRFCRGIAEAQGPASAPFMRSKTFQNPQTLILQGVIQDSGADNTVGYSVTNRITLVIE